MAAFRDVLKVNPNHQGAVAMLKENAYSGAGASQSGAIPTYRPKKKLISLDLKDVDIRNVLRMISKDTGINIVSGKDVTGNVSMTFYNIEPEQAIDTILRASGYNYEKDGNVIRVYSSKTQIESKIGNMTKSFVINYITLDELKATLTSLLPSGTSIMTNPSTKTLVIEASQSIVNRAEQIIKDIDLPPDQVMVEAEIIETSLSNLQTVGINLKYTSPVNNQEVIQTVGQAAKPTDTGSQGLFFSVVRGNKEALLQALQDKTNFNVLSSPKIIAMNGQKANIITGNKLGYYVNTVTTTGLVQSVEFLDIGTTLTFTPEIKKDGRIIMEIHPEVSEGTIVSGLPQKTTTETTTKVVVKDGETIIIGGLSREKNQKETKGPPILSDIPLIGSLFRRTEIVKERVDIIVLMTPHIITESTGNHRYPNMRK